MEVVESRVPRLQPVGLLAESIYDEPDREEKPGSQDEERTAGARHTPDATHANDGDIRTNFQ